MDGRAIVSVVTFLVRVLGALVVAGVLAVSSSAEPSSLRMVVFVAVHGQGTITSTPRGVHCPKACWVVFAEHSHITLHAKPAAGWKLGHIEGWCKTKTETCSFDLVSPHDCIGGACPLGAFGSRAYFVRQTPTN
jgi:hypothetical protein